jgi:hypothetical protein
MPSFTKANSRWVIYLICLRVARYLYFMPWLIWFIGIYGRAAHQRDRRTQSIRSTRSKPGLFTIIWYYKTHTHSHSCIAIPLSWYAVNSWLSGFRLPYRMLGWLVFFIASAAALGIAWITVSYESIKAATVNPIKSLTNGIGSPSLPLCDPERSEASIRLHATVCIAR